MRALKKLRNRIILVAVAAGAGAVAYRVLLTPEARQSLRGAFGVVSDSYQKISDVIQDMTGIVMEEDKETLPNRQFIIEQWKSLGF